MRKRKQQTKLSRDTAHRNALLRNLSQQLIQYGRIETTITKAKALRPFVEPLITRAKQGGVNAERLLAKVLYDHAIVKKLITEVAPKYADRNGGYTQIIKLGERPGDAAELAVIQLVVGEKVAKDKTDKKAKK